MNQCPLDIAIQQFFSSDGIDAALYATYLAADTVDQVLISPQEWILFQQHEGGFQALKDYTTFCQHAQVIVHEELFESQRTMERPRAQFFEIRENVSSVITDVPPAKDLTKRPLNQIVTETSFFRRQ